MLLPDNDWRKLAKPLFEAIRHGLAHRFDTKHIEVNGQFVQIYLSWGMKRTIEIQTLDGRDALFLGTCRLRSEMCRVIQDFRCALKQSTEARQRYKDTLRYRGTVDCSPDLWQHLKRKCILSP